MARKKQTARKSTWKGKLPHEVWPQWVQQVQGPAPVRQKEDSEDEVVQQPITNNWTDCKECSIWGTIQGIDSHCQQVHGPAPIRQIEDSEDEVVKQPVAIEWTT